MTSKQPPKSFILPALLLLMHFAIAQTKTVTGKVTDSKDGSAIAGVSVIAKGTPFGTQTDSSGNFRFTMPSSVKKLSISGIGFLSQEVDVSKTTNVEIKLAATSATLIDEVVIGYGTSKKNDLTGAIGYLSENDFNKGIYTSPDQLIQGRISGVQVTSNDGSPGGAITIMIRGNSALSSAGQPLYVVDGIPLDGRSLQTDNNPLNFLNPIDIASIDVLKDASATAIYGSRAAFGVVIINTKKGQPGATKLEVAASSGLSSVLKKIQELNASQYRDALQYYGVSSLFDKGGSADGQDAVLRTVSQQNYSIAGSGGNENGKYRFSAGYLNQDGILLNTTFKKYNSDISANFKLLESKKLGLDLHVNSSQYIQQGSVLTAGDDGTIFFGLTWNPTASLRNSDGSIIINPADGVNPDAFAQYANDNLKVTTILGSISPYYKFTDWLEYKLLLSINYGSSISRTSMDQALAAFGFQSGGSAAISNNELITEQITHTLNFNKEIFRGLNLNAVAGYEYLKFTSRGFNLSVIGNDSTGFGSYGINYTNYIQYSDPGSRNVSSYLDPLYELQSYFGRTMFNYKEKYLLTATFRADGSTKFGANNKYGYFPSFAVAWNINKEDFFKADWMNSLKVRAGWGKTGNQEFPPGSSQALYALQNGGGIAQVNNPNPDLKWQSDRQYNFGVDFSVLNNRISGTLDYFNKNTTNLLFPSPPIQPAPPNSAVRWINLDGHIINQGLEVLINGAIIKDKDFSWDLSVNATFIHNNVSGLPVPIYSGDVGAPIEIIKNGLPFDAFYTRKFLGLDKSTGLSVYQGNADSLYYVGDPNPKTLLGISSTFRYKKVSLAANVNGSFGQKIFNASFYSNLNVYGIYGNNMALSVYQSPIKESLVNPSQSPSSRYIENGNYLKMANLTLSYKPGNIAKTFKGTNIYLTVQNLFLITKYQGFDPEVNVDRNINGIPSLGIDYMRYPSSRSFIFGINFSL
jgi:TonB-linked SusC/RagA family outer membrane protein